MAAVGFWLAVCVGLLWLLCSGLGRLAARLCPEPEQRYLQLVEAARVSSHPTQAQADALWCAERERELAG